MRLEKFRIDCIRVAEGQDVAWETFSLNAKS